jgi:dihydroorotate dehydrogenase (NAD+) catalytic subunit
MFAQSPAATRAVLAATAACGLPRWAKLTAAVADIAEIAAAAAEGGAEAVTLVNTLPGMAIDPVTRRRRLGGGGGGLSGPAVHPVAVRAVWDVRAALAELPIVGVGGVARAEDAVELLLAGASAVEVGTATFADPRAPAAVLAGLGGWCRRHGVGRVADLVGAAHAASLEPDRPTDARGGPPRP